MTGALAGIRVFELAIWQQGTVAGVLLGDMGADVIKVEGPDSPDPGRWFGQTDLPANGYFETNNHNKRGAVIDLKHPAGRETFYRLLATADVFLTNLRIGALERLGLTYAELSARYPRLVYGHGTGFGAAGPEAREGAFDVIAQARSGIMWANGTPDTGPLLVGAPIADQVGGLVLAWGVLVAVYHAQRTGEGQLVNSSILAGQMFAQGFQINNFLFSGQQRPRPHHSNAQPLWASYQAGDSKWFVIASPHPQRWWPRFCQIIERPELEHDPEHGDIVAHPENYAAALHYLQRVFLTRPRYDWLERFRAADLPCSPAADYQDLTVDPQVLANDLILDYEHPSGHYRLVASPVNLSATPAAIHRPAPEFGQHTEEVLLEAGFDWTEIEVLRSQGAIGPRGDGPTQPQAAVI